MRMYDIIKKKRDGGTLTKEEIEFFISGYVSGDIPDYQASALLMAIYFRGMNVDETTCLTLAITNSGDKVDLSGIKGFKADKHSTGGVGDKTTLIVAPIVASAGVKVAKMSGRGLGHTGGTVDKLESIPGYETSLSRERFFEIVNTVGCSVIGQSGELAPADKKLYALRDVTATVDKRPLIASSIMGKKLASGADGIVLDVKVGSGAFNKTFDEGLALAKIMVNIGNKAGKITRAVITNMDKPLGYAVGNAIEVKEAVEILKGNGDKELKEICIELASNMLYIAGRGSLENCKKSQPQNSKTATHSTRSRRWFRRTAAIRRTSTIRKNSPLASFRATSKPIKAAISSIWTAKSTGLQALLSARGATKKKTISTLRRGLP